MRLYGYHDSSFTGSDSRIADRFFGIDLFIGHRLYGGFFYHYEKHFLLGLPEPIGEGFVKRIVYHTEFVDGYSLGLSWVLYINHNSSKSLSLHIILVIKLCCEDNFMGSLCQDGSFGYLL